MKKSRYLVFVLCFIFITTFLSSHKSEHSRTENSQRILNISYSLQIPFIENKGQIEDESLKYYAKTFGGTVFVTEDGQIVYSLPFFDDLKSAIKKTKQKGWVLRETLLGGSPIEVTGKEKATTKVNTFKGKDPSKWQSDIPTYKSVGFGEVYEGIELKLQAYANNIEKIFTVEPGADVSDIRLKLEGITHLDINEKGELEMQTGLGTVSFTEPVAYQEEGETRNPVDLAYVIHDTDTYGFEAGSYDRTKPLVIDPLIASTFLGAGNGERGNAITVRGPYVAVAGWARAGFPTTPGAYDEDFNGGDYDAFISIFDSDLTTLYVSTFIGGNGQDACHSIFIDNDTNIFIAGYTDSTDYPTTTGAYDESYNNSGDVFVSKINSNLSTLLASTYIGGGNGDYCHSCTRDASGNIYITGYTYSTNFPVTPGAYDVTADAGTDVFISKFSSDLSTLSASTYMGGSDGDFGDTVCIYGTNTVYIVGSTRSSNFPTTGGAYDESFNGSEDVFVAIFNSSLDTLSASTFIGGSSSDRQNLGSSLAFDGSGNIFITGETYSSDYPTTSGAYDETFNGGAYDAFVSKLDNGLTTLSASTYLGGDNSDSGNAIVYDGGGNVYIVGSTQSPNFPSTSGAYDELFNGDWDNFISKLDNNLTSLWASTFLGGSSSDSRPFIDLDGSGNVYITGYTYSSDFPSTSGVYDESFNGSFDVFVSKLDGNLSAPAPPLLDVKANGSNGPITIAKGQTLSITVSMDPGEYAGQTVDWWVLCQTPHPAPFDWYYYRLSSKSWLQGQAVTRQGPVIPINHKEIMNRSDLPPGTYTFYFGVDLNVNGSIDLGVMFYDRVKVTINP